MKWLRRLYHSTQRTSSTTPRSQSRARLSLEALETRLAPASVFVVPLSQPEDSTHVHNLASAIGAAGAGGLVTVEPGALPLNQPVSVTQAGITVQGDPNVPASILTPFALTVAADNVTLTNLNLGSVQFGNGHSRTNISKCLIDTLIEMAGSGGNNTITQNLVTRVTNFGGNPNGVANDLIANNTFESLQPKMFFSAGAGTVVTQNIFLGGDPVDGVAVFILNSGTASAPMTFANNTITPPAELGEAGILLSQNGSGISSVRILNNTFNTQGTGLLMRMDMGDAAHFQAYVQGNDFHNNAVGVSVAGDGTACGTINLNLGVGTPGGNNFRGFTAPASASHAAIILTNSPNGGIFAEQNMFRSGVSPFSVVVATGTAGIDVSHPLSDQEAFVEALYNEVLGRTGALSELDGWVNVLNTQGQAAVVNDILRSGEALGHIVDSFYLRFLGRQADANGRSGWVSFLQHGGTEEQLENLFLTSPEYINHINTDFVQSLYLNILGRTGDTGGLSFWNNQIQALGLAGIANGFTASGEGRQNVLRSDFQTLLHRTPSNAELAPLVNSTQDLLSLEALVLSSPEFFTNG